jgi:hypothetical protein
MIVGNVFEKQLENIILIKCPRISYRFEKNTILILLKNQLYKEANQMPI